MSLPLYDSEQERSTANQADHKHEPVVPEPLLYHIEQNHQPLRTISMTLRNYYRADHYPTILLNPDRDIPATGSHS
ncbi:hypothetical protein D3C71_2031640 [compost metagenome]